MRSELDYAQFELGRRRFLRGALAVGALGITARSFPSAVRAALLAPRHFAPVKVARNRVIREVVGLRPYRPDGFRVATERLGQKLLIHNYGHGGAGVTLSWGTASLAVDLVQPFLLTAPRGRRQRTSPRFAVLGCGVNGLSTARLLQRRFQNGPGTVTIYAKNLPPDTTSNIAGAFWYPTSSYDHQVITPQFTEQFRNACRISNRAFQLLVGAEYGVRWIECFDLQRNEEAFNREIVGGSELYPQLQVHRDPDQYFGFPFVREFSSMMIEPQAYLRALLRDFYVAGGRVVVKEFANRTEVSRLTEPVVFNCTGLGAGTLFGDETLEPVRGQLEVLLPQAEIDYCYLSDSGYMFPRQDGIILGGTFQHGNWQLEPNPQDAAKILAGNSEVMSGLKADR
jgi:glycine/D-amino acid oxidase-like deaminating enzyme